jgi:hypothetical protein
MTRTIVHYPENYYIVVQNKKIEHGILIILKVKHNHFGMENWVEPRPPLPRTCRVKVEKRWAQNPSTFFAKNRGGHPEFAQTKALQNIPEIINIL